MYRCTALLCTKLYTVVQLRIIHLIHKNLLFSEACLLIGFAQFNEMQTHGGAPACHSCWQCGQKLTASHTSHSVPQSRPTLSRPCLQNIVAIQSQQASPPLASHLMDGSISTEFSFTSAPRVWNESSSSANLVKMHLHINH